MNDNKDDLFEQRLRDLLAKTEDVKVPKLTQERLEKLRALIPRRGKHTGLYISLMLEYVTDGAREILSMTKMTGLVRTSGPAPVMRDEHAMGAKIDTFSLALPKGELQIQMVPFGYHKARLILSIKGQYTKQDDLSVELSHGQRLIEARPLEQKTEVLLNGTGLFSLTVLSGEDALSRINLDIGENKGLGNGG